MGPRRSLPWPHEVYCIDKLASCSGLGAWGGLRLDVVLNVLYIFGGENFLLDGTFSDGMFSYGTFSDGMFSDWDVL